MASEILKLSAAIVTSHASMTELSTTELVKEIKEVFSALSSLAEEPATSETAGSRAAPTRKQGRPKRAEFVESPEAKAVEVTEGPVIGDPDYMEFMESREG
ncbi:MAG: MucR family transcriptional regulator [Desulfobaccales bacterium]